ncbi:MAG: bifunctional metallophosphatase/5'-nucleotidase [Muribaculaceae bacterium]|nr:bifunctional metallophosphatase/5'-nucleotidase [Muribaculaceae bacterium]
MKKNFLTSLIVALSVLSTALASADNLVILHTNDTHSNIDVAPDGTGGVLPRKAIIDSVRNAEKNVILVDAGDMVQGTLYFNYFRGDVEYPLFNLMDYDIRILGNHEFDNGLRELADHWKEVKGARLSANYDFTDTPAKGLFEPYVIKKIGKKKIGFIGINIAPESLISSENYKGMKYVDAVQTANHWASFLKNDKKCDLVVAVTHIGYTSDVDKKTDVDLARESKDIDIIIGGHSHTFVNPATPDITPYWIENEVGQPVLVTQTGRYGKNVGYINIDLEKIAEKKFDYQYIPVTDRFAEDKYDSKIISFLAPYKQKVDSVNNHRIGVATMDMNNGSRTGAYPNWGGDFALWYGRHIADSLRVSNPSFPEVDFAMVNVGGIRQPMKEGAVTEGLILSTFPFSNFIEIVRIKGVDFIEAMKVAAAKGGEAISGNLRVVKLKDGDIRVLLNNEPLDPDKEYTLTTIDYLANGNDGLKTLGNNTRLWSDPMIMNVRILEYINRLTSLGLPISSDPTPRFVEEVQIME